jgi:hypothetical protein
MVTSIAVVFSQKCRILSGRHVVNGGFARERKWAAPLA